MSRFVALVLALASFASDPVAAEGKTYTQSRYLMGTVLNITINLEEGIRPHDLFERSFAIVAEIEDELSLYRSDSALSRLNRGERIVSSKYLGEFLSRAEELRRETAGLFNPAVKPLVDIWRQAERTDRTPEPAAIKDGASCLESWPTQAANGEIFSKCRGMMIDSDGVGKGFALDIVAKELRRRDVRSALLDFGTSSVVAIGGDLDNRPWQLVVSFNREKPIAKLLIRDLALSASDTFKYDEVTGKAVSRQIIDPRNKRPVELARRVIVAADGAADAEAESKGLILAPQRLHDVSQIWGAVISDHEISALAGLDCVDDQARCVQVVNLK